MAGSEKMKDQLEFKLTDDVQVYIVEDGMDIEIPDLNSPYTGAVCTISLDKEKTIKLANSILEYYKSSK